MKTVDFLKLVIDEDPLNMVVFVWMVPDGGRLFTLYEGEAQGTPLYAFSEKWFWLDRIAVGNGTKADPYMFFLQCDADDRNVERIMELAERYGFGFDEED